MNVANFCDSRWIYAIPMDLFLLSALCFLVLLPGLGQTRHLRSREGRHAEIIREMSISGDYFVPTLMGKPYYDKPPVLHAAAAIMTKWWGKPSMAIARLPSALAGWLAVLSAYGVGLILINRTTALVGAVMLLGMVGFYSLAQQVRPDMILCAAIALSGLALLLGMRDKRPPMRALAFAVAGVFAGVGTLTKGPWGIVFPVLLAVMVWLARRDWRFPRAGWVIFAVSLLVVVGAWAVPVFLRDHGHYLSQMLNQRDLQVGEAEWDPFDRYLTGGLGWTLPMSLFLPLAIRDCWRRGYSPLLAFALAVVLIFMVIPKKRPHYVLPMYPFLAVGIAAAVTREASRTRWFRATATIVIGASLVGLPLHNVFIGKLFSPEEDPDFQAARKLVGEIPPHSRVYTLAMLGHQEVLAWIGDRRIQVVDLPVNEAAATTALQGAPSGAFVATTVMGKAVYGSTDVAPRLQLVAEVWHPKREFFLFRIVDPGG